MEEQPENHHHQHHSQKTHLGFISTAPAIIAPATAAPFTTCSPPTSAQISTLATSNAAPSTTSAPATAAPSLPSVAPLTAAAVRRSPPFITEPSPTAVHHRTVAADSRCSPPFAALVTTERSPATATAEPTGTPATSPLTTAIPSICSLPIAVTQASLSPPSTSSFFTQVTTAQKIISPNMEEKPQNPPPFSPSIIDKNQTKRVDLDLNISIMPLEINTESPPGASLSSITNSGNSQNPICLDFLSEKQQTTESSMNMDAHVNINLSQPRWLPVNPQHVTNNRINRGTGYFQPNRAGLCFRHSHAGSSSGPRPAVLADPHRPHLFWSQNVQNPVSRAPNDYPVITDATPLRYRPPPETDKDLSFLPNLTPYQLQRLNELAQNTYPLSSAQPIRFNPKPIVGMKRPTGVVFQPVQMESSEPDKKKQDVKGKGITVSATEFSTWKIYQDRMKQVAVEAAEQRVYKQLWGNIVSLQRQCTDYNQQVTDLSLTVIEREDTIASLKRDLALRNNPPGRVQTSIEGQTIQGQAPVMELIDEQQTDQNGNVLAVMLEEFDKEHGEKEGEKHPTPRE